MTNAYQWAGLKKDRNGNYISGALVAPDKAEIIRAGSCEWEGQLCFRTKKEADFILRAVNAHDALIGALEEMTKAYAHAIIVDQSRLDRGGIILKAHMVLKQALGES